MAVRSRQRVVTEVVTVEGTGPIDIHSLRSVRGADYIETSSVRCWVRRFER